MPGTSSSCRRMSGNTSTLYRDPPKGWVKRVACTLDVGELVGVPRRREMKPHFPLMNSGGIMSSTPECAAQRNHITKDQDVM